MLKVSGVLAAVGYALILALVLFIVSDPKREGMLRGGVRPATNADGAREERQPATVPSGDEASAGEEEGEQPPDDEAEEGRPPASDEQPPDGQPPRKEAAAEEAQDALAKARLAKKARLVLLAVSVVLGVGAACYRMLLFDHDLLSTLQWLTVLELTVTVAATDFKAQLIPNKYLLVCLVPALVLAACAVIVNSDTLQNQCFQYLGGCALGALLFFVARLITRGGVGFGDIKYYAVAGLLLGFTQLLGLILVALSVAFIVSILLLVFRRKHASDLLPMAPFALVGVVLSIALGS